MNDTEREPLTPVGQILEAFREAKGLSKREAAKRAAISEARWRQIVTGRQRQSGVDVPVNPRRDTIINMAGAVGAVINEALQAAGFQPERILDAVPTVDAPPENDSAVERLLKERLAELELPQKRALLLLLGRPGSEARLVTLNFDAMAADFQDEPSAGTQLRAAQDAAAEGVDVEP